MHEKTSTRSDSRCGEASRVKASLSARSLILLAGANGLLVLNLSDGTVADKTTGSPCR